MEGKFLYAGDARLCRKQQADVAFLDIEMPEMSGLELAERLMEIDPLHQDHICYSLQPICAGRISGHAIGYLLKPIDRNDLRQVDCCTADTDKDQRKHETQPERKLFRRISVSAAETTIRNSLENGQGRELFALLIHYQGKVKPKDTFIDTLWPEMEPEKIGQSFSRDLHLSPTALAEKDSAYFDPGEDGFKINTELIECDLFRFRFTAGSAASREPDR